MAYIHSVGCFYPQAHPGEKPLLERTQAAAGTLRTGTASLVIAYLPLVRSIAVKLFEALPPNAEMDLDDLVQSGTVGLIGAARAFDPGLSVDFSVYARHRIKGEICDAMRRLDTASRQLRQWERHYQATERRLTSELGHAPINEELATALGTTVEAISQNRQRLSNAVTVARNSTTTVDEEDYDGRWAAPAVNRPDAICRLSQRRVLLSVAVGKLPDRQRRVLRLYYDEELTLREIGRHLKINESRVCQIHKVALKTLQGMLRSGGVCSTTDL